jgi:hypothetical protein
LRQSESLPAEAESEIEEPDATDAPLDGWLMLPFCNFEPMQYVPSGLQVPGPVI